MGLDHGLVKEKKGKKYNIIDWRKENHIHEWFVNKNKEGDNGEAEIPLTTLKDFYKDCCTVVEILENAEPENKPIVTSVMYKNGVKTETIEQVPIYDMELVEDVMPTRGGFFFGSTEIDRYYLESVIDAKHTVKELLDTHKPGIKYYYWSWW